MTVTTVAAAATDTVAGGTVADAAATDPITGGCQCGALRYRITAAPLKLYCCHCRDCQKQSASAFGMSLLVAPSAFELLRGEAKVWATRADSGAVKRCAFCRECGSRIYHAGDDPAAPLRVRAGSLDDTADLAPAAHIWTSRAQRWLALTGAVAASAFEPPD